MSLVAVRVLAGRGAALGAVAFSSSPGAPHPDRLGAPSAAASPTSRSSSPRRCWSRLALWLGTQAARTASRSPPGSRSGPPASSPSGAGRTSGCRSRGRRHISARRSRSRVPVAIAGAVIGAFLAGALRPSGPALQRGPPRPLPPPCALWRRSSPSSCRPRRPMAPRARDPHRRAAAPRQGGGGDPANRPAGARPQRGLARRPRLAGARPHRRGASRVARRRALPDHRATPGSRELEGGHPLRRRLDACARSRSFSRATPRSRRR